MKSIKISENKSASHKKKQKKIANVHNETTLAAGIFGNMLWLLADKVPQGAEQTLRIKETQQLLSIEWGTEQSVFLRSFLQGYNLLSNSEFCNGAKSSLNSWVVDDEELGMVGVDFSQEWHLTDGHTAFLYAPEHNVSGPSMVTEQKIPVIKGVEYQFSGFFALHRANGNIIIEYYDNQDRKVDEQCFDIYHNPEFGGGISLEGYEHIENRFLPVNDAVYLRIKIELGEPIEKSESGAFLFCSQLFLGFNLDGSRNYRPYSHELELLIEQIQQQKWHYFATARIPRLYNSKQLSIQLGKELLPLELGGNTLLDSLLASGIKSNNLFDDPKIGVFSVDKSIMVGRSGILLYGCCYFMPDRVKAIYLHNDKGELIDISDSLFKLSRGDFIVTNKARYPEMTEYSGFISYIPAEVNTGERWFIEIELTIDDSEWLAISFAETQRSGMALIKDILSWDLGIDRIRPKLYELFDLHLGKVIDTISAARTPFNKPVHQQQFGGTPENPAISVIIPLYGRYDFIRHQLAHFADDPDFQHIDLIYVIDDPSIIYDANELAVTYFPVFQVPFRTIWYEDNLGFSGANNIGASVARGDTLLLMNSDILPKSKGWVTLLYSALNKLPEAGAVGPLLQFADESVQHAGMQSKRDARLPGFVLNAHLGKGQPWRGDNAAYECDMLTAACIILKKQHYLAIGGLDEAYLFGDFEDSDLCLALRKQGKRLYLLPEVKLWHLERQSQNLQSMSDFRQLITLYNGWHFRQKIIHGSIADPEAINQQVF